MKKLKLISLLTTLILLSSTLMFYPLKSNATTVSPAVEVLGQFFYIKNAYTGRYLDVPYANAYATQNIWECEYTGSTAQQWKMLYIGDGEFRIVPRCAAVTSGDGSTTYSVCLDIDAATNTDGSNLQLYYLHDGSNQRFGFTYMSDGSYKISTAFSDHNKVLAVQDLSYANQANVAQYTYQNSGGFRWILEPVNRDITFGSRYETNMIGNSSQAFPKISDLNMESTNFASQVLLNSGIHYTGNWSIYRNSNSLATLTNINQIVTNWEVPDDTQVAWCNPSKFRNQHSGKIVYYCKGSLLTSIPELGLVSNLVKCDVVQMSIDGISVAPSSAIDISPLATMSVTNTSATYNGNTTLWVEYRSAVGSTTSMSLLQLASLYPNRYFVFYKF